MLYAPKRARGATPLATLLLAATLPVSAHVTLDYSTTSESGAAIVSGPLKLLTSEGQAIIGSVRSGLIGLETGFLYSLRSGGAGDVRAHLKIPRAQCSVSDGKALTIVGTVGGAGLKAWTLGVAAGQHAESGFQTIASGDSEISAARLGVLSTAGLSGWQTVRLTAVDQSTGSAVSSAYVFIGDPRDAFSSGNARLAWPEVAKLLVRPCDE